MLFYFTCNFIPDKATKKCIIIFLGIILDFEVIYALFNVSIISFNLKIIWLIIFINLKIEYINNYLFLLVATKNFLAGRVIFWSLKTWRSIKALPENSFFRQNNTRQILRSDRIDQNWRDIFLTEGKICWVSDQTKKINNLLSSSLIIKIRKIHKQKLLRDNVNGSLKN